MFSHLDLTFLENNLTMYFFVKNLSHVIFLQGVQYNTAAHDFDLGQIHLPLNKTLMEP